MLGTSFTLLDVGKISLLEDGDGLTSSAELAMVRILLEHVDHVQ